MYKIDLSYSAAEQKVKHWSASILIEKMFDLDGKIEAIVGHRRDSSGMGFGQRDMQIYPDNLPSPPAVLKESIRKAVTSAGFVLNDISIRKTRR